MRDQAVQWVYRTRPVGYVVGVQINSLEGLRASTTDSYCRKHVVSFQMALGMAAERDLTFAPFDKESGVCLIKRSVLAAAKQGVMRSSFHEPVTEDVDTLQGRFRCQYFQLAAKVQKLEECDRAGGGHQTFHES